MQKEELKAVLEKIRSGVYTPKEENIAKYWLHQLNYKDETGYSESRLDQISEQMWAGMMKDETKPASSGRRQWLRLAVAASIAIAISICGYFYLNDQGSNKQSLPTYATDIAPGKQGATLVLGNGKKIELAEAVNGKLAKEAGMVIMKSADGNLVYESKGSTPETSIRNTLSTAKGQTYQLRLPDGSLVLLNAASSLSYSPTLNEQGVRRVKLEGEAYFEISKDKAHPFIVESMGQRVEVLGTHFNVNSYKDDQAIKTTLVEGSVKISDQYGSKMLIPGQQSVYTGNGRIKIVKADEVLALGWKNNEFMFESASIEQVMKMVERWYNVEVIYKGEKPTQKFGGGVSRFDHVSKVLQLLEVTGAVHFKIEGHKIYVSK